MHAGCTLHSLRGVERPVGGVRIRRASRGKDFFFTDILSVLFRPPSLPVSHSSIRLFSYSLSLSISRRFALSPLRHGALSVFVRTYVSARNVSWIACMRGYV